MRDVVIRDVELACQGRRAGRHPGAVAELDTGLLARHGRAVQLTAGILVEEQDGEGHAGCNGTFPAPLRGGQEEMPEPAHAGGLPPEQASDDELLKRREDEWLAVRVTEQLREKGDAAGGRRLVEAEAAGGTVREVIEMALTRLSYLSPGHHAPLDHVECVARRRVLRRGAFS